MTDQELCRQVTGGAPVASPALVWDLAIGQSTVVTQHVRANLFYRGLAFHRAPRLGDTLRTSTEVVALKQNRPRKDRPPTGLAVLRITTVDQDQRPVLDFWRCAMLPLRDQHRVTGHADDLDSIGPATKGQAAKAQKSKAQAPKARTPMARACPTWSAAGGWTGSPTWSRGRGWPSSRPGRAGPCPAVTSSPARRSWPG